MCPLAFRGLLVAAVLCLWPGPGAQATAPSRELEQDIAYYFPDTVGKDPALIATYYQDWVDAYMGPAVGRKLHVRYFTRLHDLETYVEQCQRNHTPPLYLVLYGEVALENRIRWNLQMIAYGVAGGDEPRHQLSVVVRRDSDIKTLADLRGRSLIAVEFWGRNRKRFERLVFDGKVALDEVGRFEHSPSSTSSLMAVHYKSAEVGVVSDRLLEALSPRTMAIWRAIRVVHKSPPIPMAVVATTEGELSGEALKAGLEAATSLHNTPEGKRWVDYTRISHVSAGTWTDLYSEADLTEGASVFATK
ncbi:MAG: PhnD/SsuA/transferrin family substrate-binding protein [Candidatus Schekmanbacteria bacterium]|nr:PhnD/SsuA/transferrin family substrate-binding protein [Candidatus Schekmanbacteria bacterium]